MGPANYTAPCSSKIPKPVRRALCVYNQKNPSSLTNLRKWLLKKHNVDLGLIEINRIIQRSSEYLPAKVTVKSKLPACDESESESEEESELEDVAVTLSDPDVLDCPICLDLLTVPVYQCENGHAACSSCCSMIQDKCPSCSLPVRIRCRVVEKILEAANLSCANRKYGCKHMTKYGSKEEHDRTCQFLPCECPESSCDFKSSSSKLYSHFSSCHRFSRQDFSLDQNISVTLEKGQRDSVLGAKGKNMFILSSYSSPTNGSAIKVIQIAPPHTSGKFSYDIKAKYEEAFITMHSSMESISKWSADHRPGKKFLQVPDYCFASNGQLRLELRINSKP